MSQASAASFTSNSDVDADKLYREHLEGVSEQERWERSLDQQCDSLRGLDQRARIDIAAAYLPQPVVPLYPQDVAKVLSSMQRQVDHVILLASQQAILSKNVAAHVGKFDNYARRLVSQRIGPHTHQALFANMDGAIRVGAHLGFRQIRKLRKKAPPPIKTEYSDEQLALELQNQHLKDEIAAAQEELKLLRNLRGAKTALKRAHREKKE